MNTSTGYTLNDRRTVRAWAMFDWANSSFALVITAAIFPAYYVAVTDDVIPFLGGEVSNSSLYAYAISASYLLIALCSPLLSGIADYGGRKKSFLQFFTTVGALACIALFFFEGMSQLTFGTLTFIVAMIGFAGGLVFYNSYLPLIVTEDRYDSTSAKGFAYGYVGSVILLVLNLIVIQQYQWFGFADAGVATRVAFLSVGLWWLGFAQIPFRRLPKDSKIKTGDRLLVKGFQELRKVWYSVRGERNIRRFLLSFLCLSAGVQTALYLAATFAEKELAFETAELIVIILLLQIVAVGGAVLASQLSAWQGNKIALLIIMTTWMFTCASAYFIDAKWQFYIVAVSVGILMGGTQALARSTYSKLLPEATTDTASYFSFYDVTEKLATVLGTFSFGFIEFLTGSMRSSVLALSVFFLFGFIFLRGASIRHLKV